MIKMTNNLKINDELSISEHGKYFMPGRKLQSIDEDVFASNVADDYAIRSERAAERAWESECEW